PLARFYEPAPGPSWRATLLAVTQPALGGLKLRCGGLEEAAFPAPEQVAFALLACGREMLSFKATAGLHHPIRHRDPGLNVMMHGFLNVFGAGMLAYHHHLEEGPLRAIVEDEDPSHFAFDEREFRWKDLAVNVEQIQRGRTHLVTSFGSCSFDE